MRRIIYGSAALHEFGDEELVELLQAARAANTQHNVTGMLIYADRSFLQHFEGEDSDVEIIWDRIRLDPRHNDIRVIADGPSSSRLFGDWTMGFAHPDREELEETLPGYRASLDYPFVSAQVIDQADTAETLLSLYARRSG